MVNKFFKPMIFGLSLLTMPGIQAQIDYKGFPQWSWHRQASTEYYLYTPDHMESGKTYPVVLYLHGCCGPDYQATLRNVVDPPVRMWHNFGENTQTIPTYIVVPATSKGWQQHFDNILMVINNLTLNQQGDPKRIIVSGFSMGAGGTWQLLNRYPGFFAAAITMGMDIGGDKEKLMNIPIWTNRGETDYFSQKMPKDVAAIRELNHDIKGDSATWVTGVNPRFTDFKGVGHVCMWDACSKQDLTGWAYSRINDGNKYPTVIIKKPMHLQTFDAGQPVDVLVNAMDMDGRVNKVEILLNGSLHASLDDAPYNTRLTLKPGDNELEAVAYDNLGKTSVASIMIKTNIIPVFNTESVSEGQQGEFFTQQLSVTGNQPIKFSLAAGNHLPKGLLSDDKGLIKGIPTVTGEYSFTMVARDAENDSTIKTFKLLIVPKNPDQVLVTDVSPGNHVGKIRKGEFPNCSAGSDEIYFSDLGNYGDLTFIATNGAGADSDTSSYLSFTVDEDVTVYVGYEKFGRLLKSTIPYWLSNYSRDGNNEIVAQYRYFGIYKKDFPKGTITLPGADAKKNGVVFNYFVMVKKSSHAANKN
jgi:hypothetical protein